MKTLNDKFDVFAAHLENAISGTSKKFDRAILQDKYNNLTQASVLLRSASLSDILKPARELSLATQSEDIDIISTANLIENTRSYPILLKIYTTDPKKIFEQLQTLKKLLEQIDNEKFYQGTKVRGIAQEKEYLGNNVVVVIRKIVTCFEERYDALFYDIDNPSTENIRRETIEGDSILSNICKVLNTKVWPDNELLVNEDALQKQLESISFMYQYYHAMPIFTNCNIENIKSGFLSLVKYAATCFSIHQMVPLTLWKNIFEISNNVDKYLWKKTLLVETALCVPQSNVPVERFFSQLKYGKSNLRSSLSI